MGPFVGSLSASGALLELQVPDEPAPGSPSIFPKVNSDEALYDDLSDWPELVAGAGQSIHRTAPNLYGSNGANWQAGNPTPGSVPYPQLNRADFNSDGVVDGADFLAWQRGFGTTNAIREHGNAGGDGTVDALDLAVWRTEFGSSSSVGLSAAENATIALAETFQSDLSAATPAQFIPSLATAEIARAQLIKLVPLPRTVNIWTQMDDAVTLRLRNALQANAHETVRSHPHNDSHAPTGSLTVHSSLAANFIDLPPIGTAKKKPWPINATHESVQAIDVAVELLFNLNAERG